jgi:hypothetical protein
MTAIVGPHGETAFFSVPLIHLAEHDPNFSGIYVPECESAWNKDPVLGVIGVQTGPL